MVDKGIFGCSWIECKDFYMRKKFEKVTTSQIEIDVSVNSIKGFSPEGEYARNTKCKLFSFDIECISGDGRFPDATKIADQVIQISCVIQNFLEDKPVLKVVLCLDDTDNIGDCDIVSFNTEIDLLIGFRDLILATDPDFLTGYNIQNFDFPYLIDRAKTLAKQFPENKEIPNFSNFSRKKGQNLDYTIKKFQSKQMGNKENREMVIDGRIMLDILPYMFREHKLRSYSLRAVSTHFLNETKDDVKHTEIKGLFLESAKTRARLAHYWLSFFIMNSAFSHLFLFVFNS